MSKTEAAALTHQISEVTDHHLRSHRRTRVQREGTTRVWVWTAEGGVPGAILESGYKVFLLRMLAEGVG